MDRKKQSLVRRLSQAAFFALTNGYARGFAEGRIYKGSLKKLCVPGLNCYSCPGALGSCPIGSLQAVLDGGNSAQMVFLNSRVNNVNADGADDRPVTDIVYFASAWFKD